MSTNPLFVLRASLILLLTTLLATTAMLFTAASSGELGREALGIVGTTAVIPVVLSIAVYCVVESFVFPTSGMVARSRWLAALIVSALAYNIIHVSRVSTPPSVWLVAASVAAISAFLAVSRNVDVATHKTSPWKGILLTGSVILASGSALVLPGALSDWNEMNGDRPPVIENSLNDKEKVRLLRWYDRQRERKGPVARPIVITEYVDYTCSACKGQHLPNALSEYLWRQRAPADVATPTFRLAGVAIPRPGTEDFDIIVEHELGRRAAMEAKLNGGPR